MYDAFVSHSSKDKQFTDAVVHFLEARSIRCWVAPRDVPPGKSYGQAILDGLKESKVMVLVLSESASASPHVEREVERALSLGNAVIPVRKEDILPSGALDFFISSVHWIDAFEPPLERHFELLADQISTMVKGKAAPAVNPAPTAVLPPAVVQTPVADSSGTEAEKQDSQKVSPAVILMGFVALLAVGALLWVVFDRDTVDESSAVVSSEEPGEKESESIEAKKPEVKPTNVAHPSIASVEKETPPEVVSEEPAPENSHENTTPRVVGIPKQTPEAPSVVVTPEPVKRSNNTESPSGENVRQETRYRVSYSGSDGVSIRPKPGAGWESGTAVYNASFMHETVPLQQANGSTWRKVNFYGWMAKRNLRNGNVYLAEDANGHWTVVYKGSDGISLRESHRASSKLLAKLMFGADLEVDGDSTYTDGTYEWVSVRHPGWMAERSPKGTLLISPD